MLDRDGQVHDALFLDLLEQSQAPCYLTNATLCLVFPAPNVRKNRLKCSATAGLATAGAAAGVPERAIMAQTGHRSLATLRKYIREGSLFLENAGRKWDYRADRLGRKFTPPMPTGKVAYSF